MIVKTSSVLIREARRRGGLSQHELGQRAGVTQSVVSAYECGARQPSVPMLQRLVEAAGCELHLSIRESGHLDHRGHPGHADSPDDRVGGTVTERLARHRRTVLDLAARHRLANVRVFGSVARGADAPGSDLDLLVEVPAGVGLFELFRCQRDLEAVLGVPVDLVPDDALKEGAAPGILADARAL